MFQIRIGHWNESGSPHNDQYRINTGCLPQESICNPQVSWLGLGRHLQLRRLNGIFIHIKISQAVQICMIGIHGKESNHWRNIPFTVFSVGRLKLPQNADPCSTNANVDCSSEFYHMFLLKIFNCQFEFIVVP